MAETETDKALLQRVANGDRTALKIIYDRHSEALCRFASNWLSDPFEASDIMHETMIQVWRSAGKFAGRSSVKSWIFAIARNKAIDRNRKSSRMVNQEADPDIPDEAPNPQAMTEAFQDANRVRACVAELGPAHKSVIQMAFFEDLSYREIAEIEGKPVGTIKTRVMHAKKLLLRCLGRS